MRRRPHRTRANCKPTPGKKLARLISKRAKGGTTEMKWYDR